VNAAAKLLQIVSSNEAFLLNWHLANENSLDWYGVERRGGDGVIFRWQFTTQPHVAIVASLKTMAGISLAHQRLAFVPFPCNMWRRRSRWAAARFVATNGDASGVRRCAFEAYARVQHVAPRLGWILEATGDAWHVWAVALGYRDWWYWQRLLEAVVPDVELRGHGVRCDLFPSQTGLLKMSMLGLRAPGTWNPATQQVAEIHRHNLGQFLPLIARRHEGWLVKGVR
jgi:hypothetical protein